MNDPDVQKQVDKLQREILSICKRRFTNEGILLDGARKVAALRRQLYAIRPTAALYYGWGHGDSHYGTEADLRSQLAAEIEANK